MHTPWCRGGRPPASCTRQAPGTVWSHRLCNPDTDAVPLLRSPINALQELVKSIDALSRDQLRALLQLLGLQNAAVPVLLPGASRWVAPADPCAW